MHLPGPLAALVAALLAVPAYGGLGAVTVGEHAVDARPRPAAAEHRVCRLLPRSQQPRPAREPRAAARGSGGQVVTLRVPATTCNTP